MTYRREIPRDLFNEASLLKCLGKLSLISLDRGEAAGLRLALRPGGFDVRQDQADGSIYSETITILIGGRLFDHRRPLNSRDPWPLYVRRAFERPDDPAWLDEDIAAFDAEGNLHPDVLRVIEWQMRPLVPDLPEGVFERDGKPFFTCRGCDQAVPLECDLAEYDPEVAYCGGSPRCLP